MWKEYSRCGGVWYGIDDDDDDVGEHKRRLVCVLDKVGIALAAFSSPILPTVVHCRCCVADIEEGFGRRLRTTSPVQQQAMTVVSAMMVWGSEASTASQWLTWVL